MSAHDTLALYEELKARRRDPTWTLLGAPQSPGICACLNALFLSSNERQLPTSAFHERLNRQLQTVRRAGAELPKPAHEYSLDWLAEGWLRRDFPPGSTEEMFELTAPAAEAVRYAQRLSRPRAAATESRLTSVVQLLQSLAEETDNNPETRLATLLAEQERVNDTIADVRAGRVVQMPTERAVEQAREVLIQAEAVLADFDRVRELFAQINLQLRKELVENDGARGNVLEKIFDGIDVIKQTEEGRAFEAFWRLLIDPAASAKFEAALASVQSRSFLTSLDASERRALSRLKNRMVDQAAGIHAVQASFASGLQTFVRSREFREQRRLMSLLKTALQAALSAAEDFRPNQKIDFYLMRTSAAVRSASQWLLHDPEDHAISGSMSEVEASDALLEDIADLVQRSEIDMRTLKNNLLEALATGFAQLSIAEMLELYPAPQGLGTVVGYVQLATRHAIPTDNRETVRWKGSDGTWRRASAPLFYFTLERAHELAG
jgi:hypothetical protein